MGGGLGAGIQVMGSVCSAAKRDGACLCGIGLHSLTVSVARQEGLDRNTLQMSAPFQPGGIFVMDTRAYVVRFVYVQGLDKIENRQQYPEQYTMWQNNPAQFSIDDHAPVRCACFACCARCLACCRGCVPLC